jgi:hypothetical protein
MMSPYVQLSSQAPFFNWQQAACDEVEVQLIFCYRQKN